MATPSGSKNDIKLIIPDNLSSTNACVLEPLYGDEAKAESESEQAIARCNKSVKKKWKWHTHLATFPLVDLFRDTALSNTASKPIKDSKHKHNAATLLPGILRLPVEIRNQIYGYLFHQRLITIKQNDAWPYQKGSPLLEAITEYREPERPKAIKSIRIVDSTKKTPEDFRRNMMKSRGVSYDGIPGQKPQPIEGVKWETSLNSLLLTCKTIHSEAGPILYGATVFYFDDAQRLRGFLKTVSDRNLACITRLHVHVRTYGIPNKAADDIWEQEHVQCWTSIFAKIAKKMINLRAMRVTLTMRNVTDGLKRAFRPIKYSADWKGRAGYMLMLRPLSDLTMLEDLSVSIKATDNIMQQYEEMLPLLIYKYWELANIHPVRHLQVRVMDLHRKLFDDMQVGLEKAMSDVVRSKDVDKSFASVALVTRQYIDYMIDPIGNMLSKDYEKKED
jgi:hypothetical protein